MEKEDIFSPLAAMTARLFAIQIQNILQGNEVENTFLNQALDNLKHDYTIYEINVRRIFDYLVERLHYTLVDIAQQFKIQPPFDINKESLSELLRKLICNWQIMFLNTSTDLRDYIGHLNTTPSVSSQFSFLSSEIQERGIRSLDELWKPQAMAITHMHSFVNHSCIPNIEVSTDSETPIIKLTAIRDIAEGEELGFSYVLGLAEEPDKDKRWQALRNFGFSFKCRCPKCTSTI
eukprot:TRINITY_DN7664_c0_g1_i1.p1 TRINITY_DN7664_c0_g1~~TRINITY_DN7664_c0_g1_i1.p1  ORF type:complete len:234 (-),score=25.48 TRINITY_DN7664_c0_g1_i1:13-714(-)